MGKRSNDSPMGDARRLAPVAHAASFSSTATTAAAAAATAPATAVGSVVVGEGTAPSAATAGINDGHSCAADSGAPGPPGLGGVAAVGTGATVAEDGLAGTRSCNAPYRGGG